VHAAALSGRTAVVTGASSGIGAAFARELAARGCHLVLVARRAELLEQMRAELIGAHGIHILAVALDLTDPGAPEHLSRFMEERGMHADLLVNNAGMGLYGRFVDLPWERQETMVQLDVLAPLHLTRQFLPDMLARGSGYIMQIASLGAWQPAPRYATYGAAKAFVRNWAEALDYELRGTGVRCVVVSPGTVATEFLTVSGQRPSRYQRRVMMSGATVARIAIDQMLRGRGTIVPGWFNSVGVELMNRLLPRRWCTAIADRLVRETGIRGH
jgi:short-subunit dehydrogenase